MRPDVEIVVTGLTAVSNLVARHPRPQRWVGLTGIASAPRWVKHLLPVG